MSAVLTGALADLESRAGASDQNRAMWLLERMQGITATEIRELYLRRKTIASLVNEKLSGKIDPPLTAPVVVWGNEREPVIAAAVEARFGIRPERRVFQAKDNPRMLASPDGVGLNYDEELLVSEIKTAGMDISVGSPAYVKKGYGIQQQWSMRVIGARRSLFAFEERIEVGPNEFVPGELSFEWVEYDGPLVAELESIARTFLAALDAERERRASGEGPVVDEELDTVAVNYLRFKEMWSMAGTAKEKAFAELKVLLAGHETFEQESPLARIKWTRGGTVDETQMVETTLVHEDAARDAHPDLFVALHIANAAVLRAAQKHAVAQASADEAQAAVDEVLKAFTTSEVVATRVSRTVKENLTVTSVRTKEMKA